MRPDQAFGVAVRIFGLTGWIVALFYSISAAIAIIDPHYSANTAPASHYLLAAAIPLVTGWVLLRYARRIVGFTYGLPEAALVDV
jgi:hypothetical protein